jgi:hypothetical protein
LDNKLLKCFILGFFDGDGSVNFGFYDKKNKTNKLFNYRAEFTGALNIMNDIYSLLSKTGFKFNKHSPKNKNHLLSIQSSHIDCLKFLRWLYSDPPKFFLHRKYYKFQQIFQILSVNYSQKNKKTKEVINSLSELFKNNLKNNYPLNYNHNVFNDSFLNKSLLNLSLLSKRSRKVLKIDKQTGCILKEYERAEDAAHEVSGLATNIRAVASGKGKTAYGFVWRYKD